MNQFRVQRIIYTSKSIPLQDLPQLSGAMLDLERVVNLRAERLEVTQYEPPKNGFHTRITVAYEGDITLRINPHQQEVYLEKLEINNTMIRINISGNEYTFKTK